MKALIFDCDGVLADTERDAHRVAFNEAFQIAGIPDRWSVELYGELVSVAGGKERMKHYFDGHGWPAGSANREQFIHELHHTKTDRYLQLIASGKLPLRPGVARLVDEAIRARVKLAVCSTSNEGSVSLLLQTLLGPARSDLFLVLAGDVVTRKKPDPEIYQLALERLGLRPREAVVVEDSRIGLLAAKAAGLPCIITKSCYTGEEDFSEADGVFDELGDPPSVQVRLSDLQAICGEAR